MKKLILIVLYILSYYSYAEVNTKVYNNYIVLYIPEIAPYSKLIKQQDIYTTINYMDAMRFVDGKVVIKSNSDGLMIFSEIEQYKTIQFYDYVKGLFIWNINNKPFTQIKLTLNKDENIIESSSLNSFNFHYRYNYDELKRLVMSMGEGMTTKAKIEFFYTNNNLLKSIYYKTNVSTRPNNRKIDFIYDDDNKLKETIQTHYSDENNSKIDKTITCSFSDYNEYGDWTKGHCIKDGNIDLGAITRKLEY
ncbi:hypothetical protein [uncultured Gilliamella sp.]|uniref:hypothetical protein n=3 Tax=Gilliamella TaxID=1193503 RepID=UPI0025D9B794|nr:hypothetical protein [uncultured Gilliamella sp.]